MIRIGQGMSESSQLANRAHRGQDNLFFYQLQFQLIRFVVLPSTLVFVRGVWRAGAGPAVFRLARPALSAARTTGERAQPDAGGGLAGACASRVPRADRDSPLTNPRPALGVELKLPPRVENERETLEGRLLESALQRDGDPE